MRAHHSVVEISTTSQRTPSRTDQNDVGIYHTVDDWVPSLTSCAFMSSGSTASSDPGATSSDGMIIGGCEIVYLMQCERGTKRCE